MSEYFHYVNHTKRQCFCNGDLGGAFTFDAIGAGLAGRAFSLLLTRSHDYDARYRAFGLGAWMGDRVACLGDHGTLADAHAEYRNITANVVRLLCHVDGAAPLLQVARAERGFFLQLVHLATTGQLPHLAPELERAFGRDWRKQAQSLYEQGRFYSLFDLLPEEECGA